MEVPAVTRSSMFNFGSRDCGALLRAVENLLGTFCGDTVAKSFNSRCFVGTVYINEKILQSLAVIS